MTSMNNDWTDAEKRIIVAYQEAMKMKLSDIEIAALCNFTNGFPGQSIPEYNLGYRPALDARLIQSSGHYHELFREALIVEAGRRFIQR